MSGWQLFTFDFVLFPPVCFIFRNLSSLEGKMNKLQKGLSHVDNKVSSLKKTFEVRTTEAAKLKVELEKEQETIEAAENLVGKLEGEYQRWSEQVS